MLIKDDDMIIGASKVVDTVPGDGSNSEKGCHTKGVVDLYISHTVHHDSGEMILRKSMFSWRPAVLYCGRFGAVQLANEVKAQGLFISSPFLPLPSPFPALLFSPLYRLLKPLFGYNRMTIGVSKVMDTIPEDASNSEKGYHNKGAIDLYILYTVRHDLDVRTMHESTSSWLPAVLYCGRFGAVQVANEAQKQVLFPTLFLLSLSPFLFSFCPFSPVILKSKTSVPLYQNFARL